MSESLRHYQAVCREAFAFLISEHAFHEISNSANTLNSYIVEFGNGEILLRVLGESWGKTARVEYIAPDGRLVPSTLLEPDWEPKARRRKKLRPTLPSQDDQIRAAAERIRVRDQEILQRNYAKLTDAASKWQRVTRRFVKAEEQTRENLRLIMEKLKADKAP